MIKDILYLGSQSHARQKLLKEARIPFKVLTHASDEQLQGNFATFADHVLAIAQSKIRALELPDRTEVGQDYLFVVTADTLIRDPRTNKVLSKPVDRQDAVQMLTSEQAGPIEVMTGCCLEKFYYRNAQWDLGEVVHWTTSSMIEFYVDDDSTDLYLDQVPIALQCSGSGVIEGYGLSYLKSVQGSYSGAIGLPLYELRQALKKLDFKF